MIFGAEYSDDYREGFDAGRASAELVCGEQHAFLEVEVEQLRAEVERLRQRRYELLHEVAELRQERTA